MGAKSNHARSTGIEASLISALLWVASIVIRFWFLRTIVLSITSGTRKKGYMSSPGPEAENGRKTKKAGGVYEYQKG